jgi:hypothetical protein
MLFSSISLAVNSSIVDYKNSRLRQLVDEAGAGKRAIKFVRSEWAANYAMPKQLKISETGTNLGHRNLRDPPRLPAIVRSLRACGARRRL